MLLILLVKNMHTNKAKVYFDMSCWSPIGHFHPAPRSMFSFQVLYVKSTRIYYSYPQKFFCVVELHTHVCNSDPRTVNKERVLSEA